MRKQQEKNKKGKLEKKKLLIIIFAIIFLSCLLYWFIIRPSLSKNKANIIVKDGIVQEMELSLGSKIPSIDKFIKGKKGNLKVYYDDWLVDSETLNEIGTYNVVITTKDNEYYSTIVIKDKIAPTLKVHDLTIAFGNTYDASSFVESCSDNSNRKCTYYFSDEAMQNYSEIGTYDVKIIARDDSYNETEKLAKLTISDTFVNQEIPSKTEKVGVIDTKIEENVKETYKYGVKVITNEQVCYEVDDEGNKKRVRSKVTSDVDRTTYDADLKTLLDDAKEQIDEKKDIITSTLELINEYRKAEKVSELKLSKELNNTANIRVLEIAWSGNFSHTRPNGKSSYSISHDLGYDITISGENMARSKEYNNANDVIAYWKTSLGSNKNILNPNYKYIGVGMTQVENEYYWVLHFSDNK